MEKHTLEYDVKLVVEDYISHDYHSFLGKGNMLKKVMMTLSYIIVFIALVLVTVKYWYLFPLTAIIIFYPLILPYLAKYRFKSYTTRKLRENLKYIITNDELTIKGESFIASYYWNEFKEVTEGSKSIYFWENDSFALLLPKRYLSKDDLAFIRKATM